MMDAMMVPALLQGLNGRQVAAGITGGVNDDEDGVFYDELSYPPQFRAPNHPPAYEVKLLRAQANRSRSFPCPTLPIFYFLPLTSADETCSTGQSCDEDIRSGKLCMRKSQEFNVELKRLILIGRHTDTQGPETECWRVGLNRHAISRLPEQFHQCEAQSLLLLLLLSYTTTNYFHRVLLFTFSFSFFSCV
jgi:hypothetical protein